MSEKVPALGVVVLLVLFARACERGANDFDSCPPTMDRTFVGDDPVCACKADLDGNGTITDEEIAQRPVSTAGDLTFLACNTDDWVPEGYFFVLSDGRNLQVPEICKVAGEPNTYVSHGQIACGACDCEQDCLPEACLQRCKKDATGCETGAYCSVDGSCVACGSGLRECGGECGACLDGSMCVDGFCTGLVRCLVEPSGVCSEKAPTWCPLLLASIGADASMISGQPCYCTLQFECNEGCNGAYQTTYQGEVE